MAAPKQGQKEGGRKGVYTINVTLPSIISAGIVAIIGFGWVFVLGVIVGRGYNPEEKLGIERIMPRPSNGTQAKPMPEGVIKAEDLQFMDSLRAKPAPVTGNAGVPVTASEIAAKNGKKDAKPDQKQDQKPDQKTDQKDAKAAKDAKAPQKAEGKDARKADDKKTTDQKKTADQKTASGKDAKGPEAKDAKPEASERFDYVYQLAAYKAEAPAKALKAKLEGSGIKVRLDTSTENGVTWYRLNALFRGTPEDTRSLKGALAQHGIDKVILRSKTPAPR